MRSVQSDNESTPNQPGEPEASSLWSKMRGLLSRWPKWASYALKAVAVALLVVIAIPIYEYVRQFNNAVDILTQKYGVNTLLAKAIAAGLLVPLAAGAKQALFGLGKRATRARFVTGAYAAGYFLVLYAVGRNASFAHSSGEVLQWYAETPEGIRFFDSPGFDTKYGIALRPVTPELKMALERRRLGQVPHPVLAGDLPKLQLFDPLTGAPRYWFYKSPSGEFELFDSPGFHPRNQELLQPLDSQVVNEITQWLLARRTEQVESSRVAFRNRYIDMATPRGAGAKRWAVLITDSNNDPAQTLVNAGAEALTQIGLRSVTPFRQQLTRDHLNDALYNGDVSLLHRLSLEQFCDGIVIGRLQTALSNSAEVEGMSTSRAHLVVRLLSANTGSVLHEFELNSLGAGFSREAAQSQATQRLSDSLRSRLAAVIR